MIDVGCTVTVPGGAGTRFIWTDTSSTAEKSLMLHRPHPVPMLEPQMLRNACTAIRATFGRKLERFEVRNAS